MNSYLLILISSFSGAFFAFFFLRLTETLRENKKRLVKNHKALCEIQLLINEQHQILKNNVTQIDEVCSGFKKQEETKIPIIISSRPGIFITEFNKLPDIKNENFINDFITFIYSAKNLNRDIIGINELYLIFREALLLKNLEYEIYKANFENYVRYLKRIKEEIIKYDKDLLRILAISRILTRESNPRWYKLSSFYIRKKYTKNFEKKIIFELEKLKNELTEEIVG